MKNMGWEWNFKWRRNLFDNEIDMAASFLGGVEGTQIQINRRDEWTWLAETSGEYSTKSAYDEMWGADIEGNQLQELKDIWKLKIPPKVVVFAWRLIRDRLPTKSNLTRRHVEINDSSCPFCRRVEEDAYHKRIYHKFNSEIY